MRTHSRRDFLRTSLATAGCLLAARPWEMHAEAVDRTFAGNATVPLGQTGIRTSRLAQGTGFNGWARQSDHTRMGFESFDRLMRTDLDEGVRFIDTADLYGTHPYIQKVIKGLPRDKYTLLSKIWVKKEDWVTPSGGAKEEVERFCKELAIDNVDIVLIHCATDAQWPEQFARVRDELSALKQKGMIRAAGVSCHDLGALKVAAANPWVDVIFARINNKGGKDFMMDGTADEVATVLKGARKNGKAVVGMKIFGAGKLTKPEEKQASLDFVFRNGLVDAITIGMRKPEEITDTLKHMSEVKVA